jgi:hypothetical protein
MGISVRTPKLRNKDAILYFENRYITLGISYIIHTFKTLVNI